MKTATSTIEQEVKEQSTDQKPVPVQIVVSQKELAEAKKAWARIQATAKKTRADWALIGKALHTFQVAWLSQKGKQPSNAEKSAYRNEHFKGINAQQASYAIQLSENFQAIDTWATKNCPDLSSVIHVVSRYNSAMKQAKNAQTAIIKNGKEGESKESAPVANAPADTNLDHAALQAMADEMRNKVFKRIDQDTDKLYTLLKAKQIKLDNGQTALLKNRFQAILNLLAA